MNTNETPVGMKIVLALGFLGLASGLVGLFLVFGG